MKHTNNFQLSQYKGFKEMLQNVKNYENEINVSHKNI